MNLFEIASEYKADFDSLMSMDDLPEDVLKDTLEGLVGSFEDKAINTASYINNLLAEADAVKQAKLSMAARQSRLEKMAARISDYLLDAMKVADVKLIKKSPLFEIKTALNPISVEIYDDSLLDPKFIRETVSISPDKLAIKQALLLNPSEEIAGARLKQDYRLVIK
jgi:hypothetical protein